MFNTRHILSVLLLASLPFLTGGGSFADEPEPNRIVVDVNEDAGKLTLKVDGNIALVYCFGSTVDLPHFDPWNSASGRAMTVKITDPYPHHRSFWVADQRVQLEGHSEIVGIYESLYTGVKDEEQSKWPVAPFHTRVDHVQFTGLKTQGDTAEFDEKLIWMDGDVPLLDELRHYRVVALEDGEYLLDFSFQLQATYGKVTIKRDASHYAIPYIRMNDTFNVEQGGGKIINSEGGENQVGTHDKRATWVDYSAPLARKKSAEGVACFIHSSMKPPHLWLTRDYGTWGPRAPDAYHKTTFAIERNNCYNQRVGLLVHNGDAQSGNVAERYQAYCDGDL